MTLNEKLHASEATFTDLQAKREAIAASKARLDQERDRIAFKAHARGDQKAADRLTELEAEEGALDRQLKSINAALRTAESEVRRLQADVNAAEEAAALAARVKAIRTRADDLQAAGEAASKAMAGFVSAMGTIKAAINALQVEGALSDSQVTMTGVNVPVAIKSELIAAGLIEPIVPIGQRRKIAEMIGNYAESARHMARDIETPKKEAA